MDHPDARRQLRFYDDHFDNEPNYDDYNAGDWISMRTIPGGLRKDKREIVKRLKFENDEDLHAALDIISV